MSIDEVQRGAARSPGLSYQQIIEADARPGTGDPQGGAARMPFGDDDIAVARYTSRAFHELEKQRLWSRVWQMACREEEIPEVGDTTLYEICDRSILLVRSAAGRDPGLLKLLPPSRAAARLRSRLPPPAPLPVPRLHLEPRRLARLRAVTVGLPADQPGAARSRPAPSRCWAGFVFVNPDPDGDDLMTFLGDLDEHFADWTLEDRYIEGHAVKIYKANWKVAQQAFMEAFHVSSTHPQMLIRMGDVNGQNDCYEHYSRSMNASGVPSPILRWQPSEQEMLDAMLDRRLDEPVQIEIPEGVTFREFSGQLSRDSLRPTIGDRADRLSDAELVDSIDYSVFPNFHPWAAYQRLVYRFRPNGDDHESCIMDVYILSPFDGDRPAPGRGAVAGSGGVVDRRRGARLDPAHPRPGFVQHPARADRASLGAGRRPARSALPGEQGAALPFRPRPLARDRDTGRRQLNGHPSPSRRTRRVLSGAGRVRSTSASPGRNSSWSRRQLANEARMRGGSVWISVKPPVTARVSKYAGIHAADLQLTRHLVAEVRGTAAARPGSRGRAWRHGGIPPHPAAYTSR